jgi:hypothetical protein
MMKRTTSLTGVVLGAALLLAGGAQAATCSVTQLLVLIRSLNLAGAVTDAVGLELPVTVDETAGTISFDLSGFGTRKFVTVGVENELTFDPPQVFSGTIDASGNVTLRNVAATFATSFTTPPTDVPIATDLSTGISTATVTGEEFSTQGTPLDLTTGALVLEGQDVLLSAPGLNTAVATGLRIACTLSPIPNVSALPTAAAVTKAAGKVKLDKAGGSKGDTIRKLTAAFETGGAAVDPKTTDLFVSVRAGRGESAEDALLLHVGAGDLSGKGRRFTAKDSDGTKIRVVVGRKQNEEEKAPVKGKLTLKKTKKGYSLTLTQSGLDLTKLAAGPGDVSVAFGSVAATRDVNVKRTAKAVSFR